MSNQPEQLKKQNAGMYNNLVNSNIVFNRSVPSEAFSDEEVVKFDQEEKPQVMKAMQEFRKSQPKAPPKKKETQPPPQKKAKVADDAEADENEYVEKKPNYNTFNNMEDLKRAFFNNEIDTFIKMCREQKYLFFEGAYNYNSDMDGRPKFVATNLVSGFVRNLEDKRKYFLNCFRCYANEDGTYTYSSYWIVNTDASISEVTEKFSDDFTFTQVENDGLDAFLQKFQKSTEENMINEVYLH